MMTNLNEHGCTSRRSKWQDIRRAAQIANDTGATIIVEDNKITIIPAGGKQQPATNADDKENEVVHDGRGVQAASAKKAPRLSTSARR